MEIKVDTLIDLALIAANISPGLSHATGGDSRVLTIRERMRRMVEDAAEQVIREAALELLDEPATLTAEMLTMDGDGTGHISLPADFCRLLSLRLSDWQRRLTTLTEPDASTLSGLASPWRCAMVSPGRPLARLVHGENGLTIETYGSADANATLAEGLYVRRPIISETDTIRIPRRLMLTVAKRLNDTLSQR